MRELSVQASNGTYSTSDRQLIDKEFVLMKNEIRVLHLINLQRNSSIGGKTGAITLQAGIDNVGGDKLGIKMSAIRFSRCLQSPLTLVPVQVTNIPLLMLLSTLLIPPC